MDAEAAPSTAGTVALVEVLVALPQYHFSFRVSFELPLFLLVVESRWSRGSERVTAADLLLFAEILGWKVHSSNSLSAFLSDFLRTCSSRSDAQRCVRVVRKSRSSRRREYRSASGYALSRQLLHARPERAVVISSSARP